MGMATRLVVPPRLVLLRSAASGGGCRQARRGAAAAAPASAAARSSSGGGGAGREEYRWDITAKRWADFKFKPEDWARFPRERAAFRDEPRLQPGAVPVPPGSPELDWETTLRGGLSSLRFMNIYTAPFEDLCYERCVESPELLQRFEIPVIEEKVIANESHSLLVPGEGAYVKMRMQAYWLALHVWLIHRKQHLVQADDGLFGSSLCALLTRRLFEWQWDWFRMWLHGYHVPIMSIGAELQDLQEFVFGLCVALDDAYKEEAAPRGAGAAGAAAARPEDETLAALALPEDRLPKGRVGLGPRIKYVLWANLYSGAVPHDAPYLYELTVYLLRQRATLERMPRGAFLRGSWSWAEHPRR